MTSQRQYTDQQIQRAIMKAFDWAADVGSEHIGVAVTGGAVTLSGEAVSQTERDAAVRLATRTAGTTVVVDEIEILTAGRNDADVARTVADLLREHSAVREQRITATVHGHTVTLMGVVDELEYREAAESAVFTVPGVRAVINYLQVRPKPGSDETREHIEAALLHGVKTEVEHLSVEVQGHSAKLEGNVHSHYERRAAERAARSVPGITDVNNQLVVTY